LIETLQKSAITGRFSSI